MTNTLLSCETKHYAVDSLVLPTSFWSNTTTKSTKMSGEERVLGTMKKRFTKGNLVTVAPIKLACNTVNTDTNQSTSTPTSPVSPICKPDNDAGGIDPPRLPPGSPNPVHDLPHELLTLGWRKFWSRREGRPYFFNKITNQSTWEMPSTQLNNQEIPSYDPVHILPMFEKSLTSDLQEEKAKIGDKRRNREEMHSPCSKKQVICKGPFWNFEVYSNVVHEGKASSKYQPHPDIEQLRAQLVDRLRIQYNEMCVSREGISAPVGSFNRWLLERKTVDKGVDDMLPSCCLPEVSNCMYKEIINDIPVKLIKPKYTSDARRQLVRYAESAKKMIETRGTSSESRKIVKWNAEDTFNWLRKQPHASYEDYLERLSHLKRQCQPHLTEAAKQSVEGICTKMYNLSVDCVKRLHDTHLKMLSEANIKPVAATSNVGGERMMCSPVQFEMKPLAVTGVEHRIDGQIVYLQYKGELIKLNLQHFQKLEQLYRANAQDDPLFELFLSRTWCMLRRYQTLFGVECEGSTSAGLQGALPVTVMECLHRVFNVTFECFASPLNCYFKQYCSAFPDTDACFGSRGSMLQFRPLSGSFEANPPFCEELMESMVDHIESLLRESEDPLSFCVCIPDWRDPPTEALLRLESSVYNRRQTVVPAQEHEYRHGFQHVLRQEDVNIKAGHGTLVIFLQNAAGYTKFTPTAERMKELKLAFIAKETTTSICS